MNLHTLTNEQLAANLRKLEQQRGPEGDEVVQQLKEAVQELQVHRVELEMQNRALRETQGELENSLRRYADLYDHLPVGYLIVSPQGIIAGANPAAAELLQLAPRQLAGQPLWRFLDPYDAGRLTAHLEACAQSGRPSKIDATLRLPDGSKPVVQLSTRLAPVGSESGPQVNIAMTDVTDLKRTQRTLEEINREQEAFNYSISHDLRAPLVTISNYARIVLTDHGAELNDESRGMIHRIENAAGRMEETLKQLLEYSTLAREEVVLQTVPVGELVRDLLIEYRGIVQERKAEVVVAPDLPAVRGSRVILHQVFANLLTNALKYTQPGQPPRVTISGEPDGAKVVLRVADQGIGIEPQHQERIFRIFERLHGYSRYPGSGVGLAIARRAVERMNGRIWVESEAGKGSCFCIELANG